MAKKWETQPNFGDKNARIDERYHSVLEVNTCDILYGEVDAQGNSCAPFHGGKHGHLICIEVDGIYQAIYWREPQTGRQLYGRNRKENVLQEAEDDMKMRMSIVVEAEKLSSSSQPRKEVLAAFHALMEKWKTIPHLHIPKEDKLFAEFIDYKTQYITNHDAAVKKQREQLISDANALYFSLCNSEKWPKDNTQIKALRDAWKQIDPGNKEEDDRQWTLFNDAITNYYEKRKQHFDKLRKEAETKKNAIIAQARDLCRGKINYKEVSGKLKALNNDWKHAGSAGKQMDEALWRQFRAICDEFYEDKRKYSEAQKAKIENNVRAKMDIIHAAECLAEGSDFSSNAVEQMKALDVRWKATGYAGPENDSLWDRFKTAKDQFYSNRRRVSEERQFAFKEKLREIIAKKENYISRLYENNDRLRERSYTTHNSEKSQQIGSWILENESKIRTAERELEELRRKLY